MNTENFQFDPLPGDPPPAEQAPAKPERKRRGPKPGATRKKRGAAKAPRQVTGIILTNPSPDGTATAKVTTAPLKPKREPAPKPQVTPYHLIKQLMVLPEAQRRQILEALNEVFG